MATTEEDQKAQLAKLAEERRSAFYNTFYATEGGRQVLFWLQQYCYGHFGGSEDIEPEQAVAALALVELYQEIRANCGVNEADVIDAEAATLKR